FGSTATRFDTRLAREFPGLRRERGFAQLLEDGPEIDCRRVDRVIGTRVRDEPGLIEILGDPHRLRGAEPDPVRLRSEHRCVEGGRGALLTFVLKVLPYKALRRALRLGHRGLCFPPRPERAVFVTRPEFDGSSADVFS